jgi:hypothetical protein
MAEKEEQKKLFELSEQLRDVLDAILATGDWQSSLFLKTASTKLKALREKSDELFKSGKVTAEAGASNDTGRKAAAPGYVQVFILLYQVDGANLQGWHRTIKTLTEYNVTRPVYREEEHAKEFIRSKTAGIDRNGYAVVNVKDSSFTEAGQQMDQFNHQLFALKQGAVELQNVVEFIHSNKRRYAVRDNELGYLGEV